jgi:hypothetical protein
MYNRRGEFDISVAIGLAFMNEKNMKKLMRI